MNVTTSVSLGVLLSFMTLVDVRETNAQTSPYTIQSVAHIAPTERINVTDMNARGDIIGIVSGVDEQTHTSYNYGLLISNGVVTTLGAELYPSAINDSGIVVGGSSLSSAFSYSNGVLRYLSTGVSVADAVTNGGAIFGRYWPSGPQFIRLFRYDSETGVFTDLGLLPGTAAGVTDANTVENVIGFYLNSPLTVGSFMWSHGALVNLPTLGGSNTEAYAINDSGQVVGSATTPGSASRVGFFYAAGTMTGINARDSALYAINKFGMAVGSRESGSPGVTAILYEDGIVTDVNSLIQPGSGWTIGMATAINDAGQIAGSGTFNGQTHVVLLTPNGSTTSGPGVSVAPVDSTSGTSPVAITFGMVVEGGTTSLTSTQSGLPPPAGFRSGQPPVYYNLETTAVFVGSATLCINYSGISYGNANNLKLFQRDGNQWVDQTSSLNTSTHTMCATVRSLSPVAIFEKSVTFGGFFPPVDNQPVLNKVKAGSAVPVKFSLGGNQGLAIVQAGYPSSQAVSCNTQAPVDAVEAAVTPGHRSVTYDAASDRYTYIWKTDKAWASSCRQLNVALSDGSLHWASFQFTK